jgi:nitroreductase
MNYSAMIQNRKSVREFRDKPVPDSMLKEIQAYGSKDCRRLIPEIETELLLFDASVQPALEGSAGYEKFLIGAPHYLLLLSAPAEYAEENAGFMMEDLVLKLTEMELDSCWITFSDGERIKSALGLKDSLQIAAIVAFGYGEKTSKRIRLNITSMSRIDATARRQYFAPKRSLYEMTYVERWGNSEGLDEFWAFTRTCSGGGCTPRPSRPAISTASPTALCSGAARSCWSAARTSIPATPTPEAGAGHRDAALLPAWSPSGRGSSVWHMGCSAADLDLPAGFSAVASHDL